MAQAQRSTSLSADCEKQEVERSCYRPAGPEPRRGAVAAFANPRAETSPRKLVMLLLIVALHALLSFAFLCVVASPNAELSLAQAHAFEQTPLLRKTGCSFDIVERRACEVRIAGVPTVVRYSGRTTLVP